MVALLKESGAKNPPGSGKPGGILKGAAAQDMGGNMVSSDVGRDLWGFKQRYIYYGDIYLGIPVVPHKAVAEVSKIGNL